MKVRKTKNKKIKYKKIVFKLSNKQFQIVRKYCEGRDISPNKFFKQAIKEFIINNNLKANNECYISENQLDLFDLVEEIEKSKEFEFDTSDDDEDSEE
ncbi:MAG: hypothetical protein PHT69_15510 [Bacteroidales bacterium]|nr:hypothetical protein [Bacteroidales bacterium]